MSDESETQIASKPRDVTGSHIEEHVWYWAWDNAVKSWAGTGMFAVTSGDWSFFINGTSYAPSIFKYKRAQMPVPPVAFRSPHEPS